MSAEPSVAARPRSYSGVLVALGVGAALMFLGYGRTWSTTVVTDPGLPTLTIEESGRDLAPAGAAMALVALAGVAALVATRRAGRLVTSALLTVAGLVSVYAAGAHAVTTSGPVAGAISTLVGVEGVSASATSGTAGWLLAALGGLLVAGGGAVALGTCSSWPVMGGRYERDAARPAPPDAASATVGAWDQLDRGMDPTLGTEAEGDR